MSNQRKPKAIAVPREKGPRLSADPDDTNWQTPVWSIAIFDHNGPWGKDLCNKDDYLWNELFPKLKNYESMTWGQIYLDRHRNHKIEIGKLIKKAQARLAELKLDDCDELFRFRLSGEGRVWGIREGRVFKLLWWDPDHEVCPSQKKHT